VSGSTVSCWSQTRYLYEVGQAEDALVQHYTAPSGARIHVSPDEQAGQRALQRRGPKPHEHQLWSFLAANLPYQAAYDLGANYGQVSLASTYPPQVPIALVEANPELVPYLERTIATHPNRESITLHNIALGDHDGPATLYVRHDAIGKSSFVRKRGDATEVQMTTFDALAPPTPEITSAIIKIDVEGSELAVLAGATRKLDSLDDYAIMIELHPGFMRRTAGSVGVYLETLCEYGRLWEQNRAGRLRYFDFSSFVHHDRLSDILIVSGDRYTERLREFNRTPRHTGNGDAPAPRRALGRLRRRLGRLTSAAM
jgi:FkbM family methyltransferase